MKRLTLALGFLCLMTAACAKHHRPTPMVNPHPPAKTAPDSKLDSPTPVTPSLGPTDPTGPTDGSGDSKPPVDSWTSLNITSPDGETLSREDLYTGPASYPCHTSDIVIIQKVNGDVIDDVAAVKADVSMDKSKPTAAEVSDAANRIGNAIYRCNQLRATVDLKTCKDPKMLLDVNNVGNSCDRLKDLKGSVDAVKKIVIPGEAAEP